MPTNNQPTVRLSAQGLPVLVLPGVGEVTLPAHTPDTIRRTMNTGREQPIDAQWEPAPPRPTKVYAHVGDWVRRDEDGALCRVIAVNGESVTLRACDDPDDEHVYGPWSFTSLEGVPEAWEWDPATGDYQTAAPKALVTRTAEGWAGPKSADKRWPALLPEPWRSLSESPEDTLAVLAHVEEVLGA